MAESPGAWVFHGFNIKTKSALPPLSAKAVPTTALGCQCDYYMHWTRTLHLYSSVFLFIAIGTINKCIYVLTFKNYEQN